MVAALRNSPHRAPGAARNVDIACGPPSKPAGKVTGQRSEAERRPVAPPAGHANRRALPCGSRWTGCDDHLRGGRHPRLLRPAAPHPRPDRPYARRAPSQEPSRIVLLGDYVNGGPDSRRVLDLLIDRPDITALRGHQDAMLLSAARGHRGSVWNFEFHGGAATLRSFGVAAASAIPRLYLDFLRRGLWRYVEDERRVFVHASVDPACPGMAEQDDLTLLWRAAPSRRTTALSDATSSTGTSPGRRAARDPGAPLQPRQCGVDDRHPHLRHLRRHAGRSDRHPPDPITGRRMRITVELGISARLQIYNIP